MFLQLRLRWVPRDLPTGGRGEKVSMDMGSGWKKFGGCALNGSCVCNLKSCLRIIESLSAALIPTKQPRSQRETEQRWNLVSDGQRYA